MPAYRHIDAQGYADEITLIEDERVIEYDDDGHKLASFKFIGDDVIVAHPLILDLVLDMLKGESERLWSMDEILTESEVPA